MVSKIDIWNNNIAALEKRYPELAERAKVCKVVNFEVFQQGECVPNIHHTMLREPWYRGVINQFFDDQWKGLKIDDVKLPLFLGFGLGYEIQYFFQKYAQQFRVTGAIIIERDLEVFVCAMKTINLTEIINNPDFIFLIGIPLNEIYLWGREFFRYNVKEILFSGRLFPIFSDMPMKIDKQYYVQACNSFLESCWDSLHNFGNCPEDSLIGLENMLDNTNEILNNPGINLLYDKFKGKPAVIVATGPSLKKNVHLLKDLGDKALILSCDATLKYLLEQGIKPHMITSLEREHESTRMFENIDPAQSENVYMTACPVLYNHTYESYTGPKIIVYRMFDHFKWFGIDKGMMDIKLSSSNMAFKIAETLGCDPVILLGQDLAYGENNETHATPVPFSSEGENMIMVKGNYVDEIKTNDGWNNFLKAYEVDLSTYKGTCYNCTEGGAFIQGTNVQLFQTIIDEILTENFYPLEIIKEGLKEFTTSKEDIEKVIPLFNNTVNDLKDIIRICDEGLNIGNEIAQDVFLKLRTSIIEGHNNTFQLFLMHVLQSMHLSLEMQFAEGKKMMMDWFKYVKGIAQICLNSLKKAREKLVE